MSNYPLRLTIAILCLCCLVVSASAKGSGGPVQVKGYTRKDGTYVAPHTRSAPNSTKSDNYSTKGNVNPYTGKAGTKSEDGTASSGSTSKATTTNDATAKPSDTKPAASEPVPARPAANLALVFLGMTKANVIAAIGEPNVKSETSWFYTNQGWVRFKGDSVVNIEAKTTN